MQRDTLKDFLQRLFPKIENVGYDPSFLKLWRKQGRICSPDFFDTYFKLFIPKDEISLREIERVLSAGNDTKAFSAELLKLNQQNKIIRFLERMEDYTREGIPEENIIPIINTLIDIGDLFPDGTYSFFAINTPMRILRLFHQLSLRYAERDQRFKILSDAIKNTTKSLYTIVYEVGVQCQQHGKYDFVEKSTTPENITVSSDQVDELVKLALKKIEEWAENGKLAEHNHLLSILFMWRRWSDPSHAKNYAQSLIKRDRGLINFIKHFLSDVRSHGMSDYIESVRWEINLNNVEEFVELNKIDKRLRKIKSSMQFHDLDNKEKLAINTFLDTRDGKIKASFQSS